MFQKPNRGCCGCCSHCPRLYQCPKADSTPAPEPAQRTKPVFAELDPALLTARMSAVQTFAAPAPKESAPAAEKSVPVPEPAAAKPVDAAKPVQTVQPAEAVKPVETIQPNGAGTEEAVPVPEPNTGTAWEQTREAAGLSAFLKENPETGFLRIQAFRGNQAIPLQGVHVTVSKELDGRQHVFFEGTTNSSGILDGIELPAPTRSGSLHPGEPDPYATYQLVASYSQYQPLETTVDIFAGIKTVQPVQLLLRQR